MSYYTFLQVVLKCINIDVSHLFAECEIMKNKHHTWKSRRLGCAQKRAARQADVLKILK